MYLLAIQGTLKSLLQHHSSKVSILRHSAFFIVQLSNPWASLVAQTAKHLLVVRETQVRSLGWKDALEKEMATHSSVLAQRLPGTGEPGGLLSMGSHRAGHD